MAIAPDLTEKTKLSLKINFQNMCCGFFFRNRILIFFLDFYFRNSIITSGFIFPEYIIFNSGFLFPKLRAFLEIKKICWVQVKNDWV